MSDLRGLSIGSFLQLVGSSLGESNSKDSQSITVGCFQINMTVFNLGLPFSDQRAELVCCESNAVKVGKNFGSLNILNSQLNLSVSLIFIFFGDWQEIQ